MPQDLKEEMKKIRKKVWDKNKKKYKDFGKFGDDEFLKQDKLPGMRYGGKVMTKVMPKEKPKDFYAGEGYKGSPDMYPDYEEDKKDIKQGKQPQHMGKKYGGVMKKKPVKAMLGMMMAKNLIKNSQTGRDIASNMGVAPRMVARKYQKEEDAKTQGMKKGGLTGGQKKLDINKDGKISGEDFKLLKGKNNKMRGGGIAIKGTGFKGVF